MPDESAKPAPLGLNDGEWGYCDRCHFLVPLAEDGTLEPHTAGKYRAYVSCGVEGRTPKTISHNEVYEMRKWDDIVTKRIARVNEMTPYDEDW